MNCRIYNKIGLVTSRKYVSKIKILLWDLIYFYPWHVNFIDSNNRSIIFKYFLETLF